MIEKSFHFRDALKLALALGLIFVFFAFAYAIYDILVIFLTAVIFAIVLDKPIEKLASRKIPRAISAFAMYLIFTIGLFFIFYLTLPPLTQELGNFAVHYPAYFDKVFGETEGVNIEELQPMQVSEQLRALSDSIGAGPQAIIDILMKVFGGLIYFLAIFFISLFLNTQKGGMRDFLLIAVPEKYSAEASKMFDKIRNQVSSWFWQKALSSLLVGLIIYLGLSIMGIPYAITLGALAFILNFIPYVGPMIASVPAILLGLTISPLHGLSVTGLYILTNGILESFVFMPIFMKNSLQMNPALVIPFVLIGGRLGGILGIIISIPVAAIATIIIAEYLMPKTASNK